MKKTSYFHDCNHEGWPDPIRIKPFFSPEYWCLGGNDSWGFEAIQSDGVEGAPWGNGPSYASLTMTGVPHLGVTLQFDRWTKPTRRSESYHSKGDISKTLNFISSLHGDQLSLGLFISFDQAWVAARQFIESDGALPTGMSWINSRDLPSGTFPKP